MSLYHLLDRRRLIVSIAALASVALYFLVPRPLLGNTRAARLELVLLGGLLLILLGTLLVSLISLTGVLLAKEGASWRQRLSGQLTLLLVVVLLFGGLVLGSQWSAHTPAIVGADGKPRPNSIAAMEKIELGGTQQWLIVRGEDVTKPVLLFLSGGPGGSEAARVLRFNKELEKHFVVVIWEQRGCGKSYPSHYPKDALTVDQYVADLVELTELLRTRFDEDKIYLVGHSWGTIIGVRAAQARPDLFHAYVGTAQMVDVQESDQLIYDAVMERSRAMGDMAFVQTLEEQGAPPYFGDNPIGPYATLFGREYELFEVPNIRNEEYRRNGDILLLMLKQPEYGWLDRVYYLLGLMNTFNAVYPQLQDLDFRRDAIRFEVPVYIVLGGHDMNNPSPIPEDYFELLEAPSKELFIFEDSGHGMIWEEAERFHQLMIETVLRDSALRGTGTAGEGALAPGIALMSAVLDSE